MPPEDPLGLVGSELDERFAVERFLHRGELSAIYQGRHLLLDQPVALKVFAPGSAASPAEVERLRHGFIRAGAVMTELSAQHSAIIHTRDCSIAEHDGRPIPFLVFEWFEGRTLERVLDFPTSGSPEKLSAEDAINLLEGVLEALALTHDAGIVHADLRPGNLLVHGGALWPGTPVKVLDFFRHRLSRPGDDPPDPEAEAVAAVVSPNYAAPEQISGSATMVGPWTDVFSVALVLVELMLGYPALAGETEAELSEAAIDPSRRPTPRTLGVSISDELEAAFAQALAVPTHARFRSMIEFRRALMDATSAAGSARSRDPRATMVVSERDGSRQGSRTSGDFELEPPEDTAVPRVDPPASSLRGGVRIAKGMRIVSRTPNKVRKPAHAGSSLSVRGTQLWLVAVGVVLGVLLLYALGRF